MIAASIDCISFNIIDLSESRQGLKSECSWHENTLQQYSFNDGVVIVLLLNISNRSKQIK